MLRQQPVDLGDPQAFRRVGLQALEAAGRPKLAAFGFEVLAIEIGHAPPMGGLRREDQRGCAPPSNGFPRKATQPAALFRGARIC